MKHVAARIKIGTKNKKEKEMKKKIVVSEALRKEISEKFNVGRVTVWRALNYVSGIDKSQAIRRYALSHGGEEICEVACLETVHDANGHMYQYLPNGVTIDFDKKAGTASVVKDGAEYARYNNVTVSAIENIQNFAYGISKFANLCDGTI